METLKKIEQIDPERPVFALKPVRHGHRARAIMLPGENRKDFNDLCDDLEEEWQPRTPTEYIYVEQMAVAHWKLVRMQIAEHDSFQANPKEAKDRLALLERIMQAQCRLERSFSRAQRDLQRLQKTRPHPAPPPLEPLPPPELRTDPETGETIQVICITPRPQATPPAESESLIDGRQTESPEVPLSSGTEPRHRDIFWKFPIIS